jgi:hypothetical protein
MPRSLRSKVKSLCYKGEITEKERDRIIRALEQEPCEDMGEVSDGYHTFNQLYHQRAVLFATIVNQNKDKSWKSFKHSDGNYCFDSNGEWFIVGIDTPQGSYTYHYAKEYWDMFDCQELECGKEWDGHTEEDVTRLLSLQQQFCEDCISRADAIKIFGEVHPLDYNKQSYIANIQKLPSVTPKARWIPVSEEPAKGVYLVTRQYKEHRYVEMATYDGDNPQDVFSWEGYSDEWKIHRAEHKVLAWKPAPEPYGGEEE